MNMFEAVKQSVTTRQAAESYGIKIRRNGMAICPFHSDKNPSMKLDNRFHCFGCQADGDVIDFVSRLYGLNLKDAAEKLATDFGVTYNLRGREPPKKKPIVKQKTIEQRYREAEAKCFRVLSDYYHLLNRWKRDFAPKEIEDVWHPCFVEALERSTYVEYLLDTLLSGVAEEKVALVAAQGKEVAELEQRIGKFVSPDGATALGGNECTGTENDGGTDQGAVGNDAERWREEQPA